QEDAAVAAGLKALRDHRISAVLFEKARLRDGRCGRQYDAAGCLHPAQQRSLGQAEMKAYHRWPQFLHHGAERRIEWSAVAGRDRRRRVDRKLLVVRPEPLAPSVLARIVWHRRRVTEEIEIDRLVGPLAKLLDLRTQLVRRQHGARQRS